MQRQRLLVLVLLVSLLVAGCTRRGAADEDEESTAPAGNYTRGPGASLQVHNNGGGALNVTMTLISDTGRELGTHSAMVEPGENETVRFAIPRHGQHLARMVYHWSAVGTASSGQDEQSFDSSACPDLTQIEWRLVEQDGLMGSQFLGKTCATAE